MKEHNEESDNNKIIQSVIKNIKVPEQSEEFWKDYNHKVMEGIKAKKKISLFSGLRPVAITAVMMLVAVSIMVVMNRNENVVDVKVLENAQTEIVAVETEKKIEAVETAKSENVIVDQRFEDELILQEMMLLAELGEYQEENI